MRRGGSKSCCEGGTVAGGSAGRGRESSHELAPPETRGEAGCPGGSEPGMGYEDPPSRDGAGRAGAASPEGGGRPRVPSRAESLGTGSPPCPGGAARYRG